jgi:hypothetical protein
MSDSGRKEENAMKEDLVYEPPALTPAGDFSEDTLGSLWGSVLDGGLPPYHAYFGPPSPYPPHNMS